MVMGDELSKTISDTAGFMVAMWFDGIKGIAGAVVSLSGRVGASE